MQVGHGGLQSIFRLPYVQSLRDLVKFLRSSRKVIEGSESVRKTESFMKIWRTLENPQNQLKLEVIEKTREY